MQMSGCRTPIGALAMPPPFIAEADSLKKSALIAMAMTLFIMTIIVNVIATSVVNRSMKKQRGAA